MVFNHTPAISFGGKITSSRYIGRSALAGGRRANHFDPPRVDPSDIDTLNTELTTYLDIREVDPDCVPVQYVHTRVHTYLKAVGCLDV